LYATATVQDICGVGPGGFSLQEAIYSSVLDDTLDGGCRGDAIGATDQDHFIGTECVKVTGNGETIVLRNGADFQLTNSLDGDAYNYMGPTATPMIFSTMTIEANGASLEWKGKGNSRFLGIGHATVTTPRFIVSGTGAVPVR